MSMIFGGIMSRRIVGIDLGSYSVKVAEITRSFKSFEFVGFYERRLQHNEMLSQEESAAIALQGLLDDQNLSWDSAYCAMSGNKVSSRVLSFPFGSTKKINQAIDLEIETFIPFSSEEIITDYGVLWSTKDAAKVLAVYVQKNVFTEQLAMLQNIDLEPRAIGAEGVDFISLVNLGMVPPEGAYAILDIGHEKTTVTICQGKRIAYMRAISMAGKSITSAIAKELDVPFEEAERMKIEMGQLPIGSEEMDDITSGIVTAIKNVIDEFMLHLRQTFFTYASEEGESIEGIYLCGGTSRLPGLDHYLSSVLKLNVTHINCSDFHFSKLAHAEAHNHVVPQALALALRGVAAGGAPQLNFRKGELAFKGDVEQLGGNMKYASAAGVLIVLLALTYFSVNYYSLSGKVDKVESDVKEIVKQALPNAPSRALRNTKAALSLIKSKEQEVATRKSTLQGLAGISPLDILREISMQVPGRTEMILDVRQITINDKRVVLDGLTDSFQSADQLKEALEKSSLFKTVTIGDRRKGVKGELKFKLSIDLATDSLDEV